MDATRHLNRVSSSTLLAVAGAAPLERDGFASAPPPRPLEPVGPGRRRRDEFEALGLLIGVMSALLALAVTVGVAPY